MLRLADIAFWIGVVMVLIVIGLAVASKMAHARQDCDRPCRPPPPSETTPIDADPIDLDPVDPEPEPPEPVYCNGREACGGGG